MEITGTRQAIRGEIPEIKSEQQKFLVCENAENFCFTQQKISLSNKLFYRRSIAAVPDQATFLYR
jgi:hypothetical protein